MKTTFEKISLLICTVIIITTIVFNLYSCSKEEQEQLELKIDSYEVSAYPVDLIGGPGIVKGY